MQSVVTLGFDFVFFWFIQAPKGLVNYFASFNNAFLKLFSFRQFATTFFKPWKNEYRQGLVGFSITMGIIIKSFMILFDLSLLFVFITVEIILILAFIAWPFATIWLLFM
ncbi:MAG TPA: hypothetical protein VF820_02875 [Patescibacteria group bacterium]